MAQVEIIGRVTADFKLQFSQNEVPYIKFGIAETIGYGSKAWTQYADVWAWEQNARQLIRRKVRKGSLIRVNGSLELEKFIGQDGITTDKRLRVKLESWDYIAAGKPGGNKPADNEPEIPLFAPAGVIDGEREPLPE
jgi:single-stranded DNA-binding protein